MGFVTALLLLSHALLGDHLPDAQIAQGKSESLLCGIDVHQSKRAEVFKRLGPPATFIKYPQTKEAGQLTWHKGATDVSADMNTDETLYVVKVTGGPSDCGRTGGGLALAQTSRDAERIYGDRFDDTPGGMVFQWDDGTELRIGLKKDRITSLMLVASSE